MSEKNPESCDHVCEHCSSNCSSRENPESFLVEAHERSSIKKMIGIVSGKGGVGKSFVTSSLAAEMNRRNYHVGILDGDITGPSIGQAFNIHEKAIGDGELLIPARSKGDIQIVSANMLLSNDEAPVIWRGPMVAGLLKQFYQEVFWDDVDYLFVDMPPGTGDVPLTAFQSFPLDGIIIVTSPQDLVKMVVEKAITMANMMNIRILGIVENMSYVECDECHKKLYVFGQSHVDEIAEKYGLNVLARIPLRPEHALASDEGNMDELIVPEIKEACDFIEKL